MAKRFMRVFYSGYVDREIPLDATEDEIDAIRQGFFDLTPEEIGKWMTEDDCQTYSTDEVTLQG